jgi:hypothetical protein
MDSRKNSNLSSKPRLSAESRDDIASSSSSVPVESMLSVTGLIKTPVAYLLLHIALIVCALCMTTMTNFSCKVSL